MPERSERFRWLAHQIGALLESLNECPSLEERKQLLRRMKILIDKIDGLILSTLKREGEDTSSSPPPDQPAAES